MPEKVSKISITGFRGSTGQCDIPFDTTKPIILIFGENGTGKSTIADAFDFVCNQSCGSLENYSLGEPARKHLASLGCKPSDTKVSLACGTDTWIASMGKQGPVVSPGTGYPDVRILRRKRILDLIEEQPKKRYEALKAFVAVPGIEKSENSLRDAAKMVGNQYDEAVRALTQAKDELEKLWAAEGTPGQTALEWAKCEAGQDTAQLQASAVEIGKIETGFTHVEVALGSLDLASSERKSAEGSLAVATKKLKDAEAKLKEQDADLLLLLKSAKDYITKKGSQNHCPVCERAIDSDNLLRRLTTRIEEMQELALLTDAVNRANEYAEKKRTLAEEFRKEFCERVKALGILLKITNLSEVLVLRIDWKIFEDLLVFKDPSDHVEQQGRKLWHLAVACRQDLKTRGGNEQKSINQHNAIKGHVDTLTFKTTEAKSYERLSQKLNAALDIVSRERKNYVEEILGTIAIDVEKLYTRLHPGEGIGKVRFFLKPNTIGSLEFDGHFFGTPGLPPQAYYSESHLDTLGICVFLALANCFKTENTLVILDDVLTSIDGPHLDRFMSLLHDQSQNFSQVIVTTHYRPWRDRYRWAKGPTANTQVIELGPWTLQNGLHTGEFLTAVDELKRILLETQFDRQAVASKTGIILESLLDFITLKYRCLIPRNARNEYTLGDLALGVDSKLGKELRTRAPGKSGQPKVETPLKPLIDAISAEQWIRNSVGCHFSQLSSEVTDGDVRRFCERTLGLASAIICNSCGMLPTRRPTGSHWQCKCGDLELFPLIYPGADPGTVGDEA